MASVEREREESVYYSRVSVKGRETAFSQPECVLYLCTDLTKYEAESPTHADLASSRDSDLARPLGTVTDPGIVTTNTL